MIKNKWKRWVFSDRQAKTNQIANQILIAKNTAVVKIAKIYIFRIKSNIMTLTFDIRK